MVTRAATRAVQLSHCHSFAVMGHAGTRGEPYLLLLQLLVTLRQRALRPCPKRRVDDNCRWRLPDIYLGPARMSYHQGFSVQKFGKCRRLVRKSYYQNIITVRNCPVFDSADKPSLKLQQSSSLLIDSTLGSYILTLTLPTGAQFNY